MDNIERYTYLIQLHLSNGNENEIDQNSCCWYIKKSNLSGRGIFAKRDINPGEIIFNERPLLIGPTGRKETMLNICTICYKLLLSNDSNTENNGSVNDDDNDDIICKNGCSLPVCKNCCTSEKHLRECKLYKEWKPIVHCNSEDTSSISNQNHVDNTNGNASLPKTNSNLLRFLTIVRGLFLNDNEKELLHLMQANNDPSYKLEIFKEIKSFDKFPQQDKNLLKYFNRVVSVLNTNAFETLLNMDTHEISLRGLYPLGGTMNHECVPNTCHEFDKLNNSMIMRSCKFIPKDTELTTTYTKLLWNNMSRRIFLTVTKGFTCKCLRCCDPTENGTFLSAIYCRKNDCHGYIIPTDCSEKLWHCIKCNEKYNLNYITKMQNFSLNIINSKVLSNTTTIKELIEFIKDKLPKICPSTNQLALETKLNVIWKMNKTYENIVYNNDDYQIKIEYCCEILKILDKLNAGECTLKKLLLTEIENTKELIK